MAIRTLGPGDAEDFAALLEALDRETEYLMFEPGERPVDLDALGRRLANRDPAAGLLYALVDPAPDRARETEGADGADGGAPGAVRNGADGPARRRPGEALAGFLGGHRRPGRRNRHALHLVVAIRQSHVGRGHGRRLMGAAERFARREGLTRLALTVAADNARAIGLYESVGFELEGRHRDAVRLGDRFRDELAYAKLLDPPDRTR